MGAVDNTSPYLFESDLVAHWASISSDFLLPSIICMLLFLKFPLQRKQQTSDLFFCRDLAISKPGLTIPHEKQVPSYIIFQGHCCCIMSLAPPKMIAVGWEKNE